MSNSAGSKVWMVVALIAIGALIVSVVTRPDASDTANTPAAATADKESAGKASPNSAPKAGFPGASRAGPGLSPENTGGPPEAPPVNGGLGQAVEVPTGVSPVMVAGAATPVNLPPHVQADRGESGAPFPFKGKKDVARFLSKRIDEMGEDKLSKYLAATYVGMTSEPASPVSTRIEVSAGKGARVSYPESQTTYGLAGTRCFESNDGVVLDCKYLDAARTWLYRGAHDATLLLPLRQAPYTLKDAQEIFAKEDANEVDSKRYLYAIADTDFVLVVMQSADDLRPMGVQIRSKSLGAMGIDSIRCRMTGWEEIDGVSFARRWHVSYRVGENASGEVTGSTKPYSVVVTAITPGAKGAETAAPATTQTNGPIRVASRPALTVVTAKPHKDGLFAGWMELHKALPPNRLTLEHGLLIAIDDQGAMAPWLDPRSSTRAMTAPTFSALAAQPAVARKLYGIPLDAIPAAVKALLGEVKHAGYARVDVPVIVRVLRWPPIPEKEGQPVVGKSMLELQVAVTPK